MCGIIGVLRSPEADLRQVDLSRLVDRLSSVEVPAAVLEEQHVASLRRLVEVVGEVSRELGGSSGVFALAAAESLRHELVTQADRLIEGVTRCEGALDDGEAVAEVDAEAVNRVLVSAKDVTWQLRWDRLATAAKALELHPGIRHLAGAAALLSIQQALQSLDRMEVRGRDSAGLQLLVWGHGIGADEVGRAASERADPLLRRRALRQLGPDLLGFTYKCAAEIGELGDNVRDLRQQIVDDAILRAALAGESVRVAVLGHTRWASVGIISEPNAHPLDERQLGHDASGHAAPPAGFAVLNGDVDNYADLAATNDLEIDPAISTDAKVIPTLWSRAMAEEAGITPAEAFRQTVSQFEGSVAIGASQSDRPGQLLLALRGSGQALYVGLGTDAFIVASELYGVVEETGRYLRLDGETPGNPANPTASRGQVVCLDLQEAGRRAGIQRLAYDGTALPIAPGDLQETEITTRDVDRRDAPHYLLKELEEAPDSWRKTLRGRLLAGTEGAGPRVQLPGSSLPPEVLERIREGGVRHVLVIGQGTAAVAGQAVAQAIEQRLHGFDVRVQALPATELSGFRMREEMHDSLVVAISQSGTTTDTNRTVDLVRSRGAQVIAIVNRRNSDLTDKADGVLYTSDGRDLEMSVASTKAFYSQVAAGFLLAFALRDVWASVRGAPHGAAPSSATDEQGRDLLEALQRLPSALRQLLARREQIGQRTAALVLPKRYWAVVGNGFNRVAAEEVRIKLSELCYKSIACDATEDKKHIDLSCEPLILVSAAGLVGSTADDVAKEVAIYRAHKATPIVIATEGEQRFAAASALIEVPSVHPQLDFVLAAMAGHLFGYEAAKAIDGQARPMRRIRTELESMVDQMGVATTRETAWKEASVIGDLLGQTTPRIAQDAHSILGQISTGQYNGHLEASSATRLATCLLTALGDIPLDSFARISGSSGTPGAVLDELHDVLGQAIDELTRPIDAIKHQAKTVTVGISRTDEAFLTVPLVRAVLESGVARDRLTFETLRTLATLDPLVTRVLGYTRYRLDGEPGGSNTTIRVVTEGGLSRGLPSRTESQPLLRGTKRSVAREGKVLVARGSSDGRLFVLVPEREAGRTVGLVLAHIELVTVSEASVLRGALGVYRQRYSRLRDAVMETEPNFREDLMSELSPEQLLIEPIPALADHWRQQGSGE